MDENSENELNLDLLAQDIASLENEVERLRAENEALRAAAPDLLEALETFADPRNWDWQEDYYAGSVALWVGKGDPVKIAKDAIAKATGGKE